MNMSLTMFLTLFILLAVIIILGFWIFGSRKNGIGMVKKCVVAFAVFLAFYFIYMLANQNLNVPNVKEALKPYVMNVNETKSVSGTQIKLYKVFMDLFSLQASYSVCGGEKVVGIELKRAPEDIEALSSMTGLWVGRRILPEYSNFGISYENKANGFIDPVYIVFYLSDGKSIIFEVKDRKGVKNLVKVVDVNRLIKFGDSSIRFTKAYKGLNYFSLEYEADFMPSNLEVTVNDGGKSVKVDPNWSGGGDQYVGYVWMDTVKSGKLEIKVRDKASGKEDVIEVNRE